MRRLLAVFAFIIMANAAVGQMSSTFQGVLPHGKTYKGHYDLVTSKFLESFVENSSYFYVQADGKMVWLTDTNLYRSAPNVLRTDDTFSVAGFIMPTGASAGYLLATDSAGNATWTAASVGSHTQAISTLSDWPSGLSVTELGYVDSVSSGIQGQLNAKAASSHAHGVSDLTRDTAGVLQLTAPVAIGSDWAIDSAGLMNGFIALGNYAPGQNGYLSFGGLPGKAFIDWNPNWLGFEPMTGFPTLVIRAEGVSEQADLALVAARQIIVTKTVLPADTGGTVNLGTSVHPFGTIFANALELAGDDLAETLSDKAASNHNHEITGLTSWPSGLDATELGYVNGTTSTIQNQLNARAFSSPEEIYRYPLTAATSRTYYVDEHTIPTDDWTVIPYLLYLGAGSQGVVRELFAITDFSTEQVVMGWAGLKDIELRVYVDAGNIADVTAPPAANLRIQAPLHLLMGGKYSLGPHALDGNGDFIEGSKPWMARRVHAGAILPSAGGVSGDSALRLKFPIPFSNGILIQFWVHTGDPLAWIPIRPYFGYASYQLGTIPTSWPYAAWRLQCYSHETAGLTANTDHTWLNLASGAGMLVGICDYARVTSTGEFPQPQAPFVNNWQMKLDGSSTVNWQTSGGEDRQGMNQYFYQYRVQHFEQTGCHHYLLDPTQYAGVMEIETWDWFEDAPVVWTNGAVGLYPYREGYATTFDIGTLAWWYGPVLTP